MSLSPEPSVYSSSFNQFSLLILRAVIGFPVETAGRRKFLDLVRGAEMGRISVGHRIERSSSQPTEPHRPGLCHKNF